jgi:hypothetical protein
VRGLLLDGPRLSAATREALARSVLQPTAKEVSFQEAEFDANVATARRMFRTAHLRITDNARHLAQWRSGAFARGSEAWLLGEALDCLARTGEAPHDTRVRQRGRVLARYARVLGGERPEHTWQRLFLTRMACPTPGSTPRTTAAWPTCTTHWTTCALPWTRSASRISSRNVSGNVRQWMVASPGRLITQALEATVFARAAVHTLSPGTDRFLIWRSAKAPLEGHRQDETGKTSGIGVFGFGISGCTANRWAAQQGFSSSPFRRAGGR